LKQYLPEEAAAEDRPLPSWDDATSLHCAASRDGVRLEVLTTPAETDVDPYRVCEALIADGWTLRPLEEGFPETPFSETFPGECFAATARFEIELLGESKRGQSFCDELAGRYLDEEIRFRAPPVPDEGALGTVVCEARRRAESVLVVHIAADRRPELERMCHALAEDGLVVTSWKVGSSEE
jgi:hypothetical protein